MILIVKATRLCPGKLNADTGLSDRSTRLALCIADSGQCTHLRRGLSVVVGQNGAHDERHHEVLGLVDVDHGEVAAFPQR